MKNFLVFIRYKVPIETVEKYTAEHRAYLKTCYDRGELLFSGPFVPRTAGLLWAQAKERETVDAMIAQDPFNTNGVADYEVIEFKPAMFAPELQAVFTAQEQTA